MSRAMALPSSSLAVIRGLWVCAPGARTPIAAIPRRRNASSGGGFSPRLYGAPQRWAAPNARPATVTGGSRHQFVAEPKPDRQRAQKQHQEDAEQPLRDGRRRLFDAGEAENAGDDGDEQEDESPFQHGTIPRSP